MSYDYSSVHIQVPRPLSKEIIEWGLKHIPNSDLYQNKKGKKVFLGREDDIHITALYGIYSSSPIQCKKITQGIGPINIQLDKVDIFTNPDKFDVVVINVISDDIMRLNEHLTAVPHISRYVPYRPHITIAYVIKGNSKHCKDVDIWKGKEFSTKQLTFSAKNGIKYDIIC